MLNFSGDSLLATEYRLYPTCAGPSPGFRAMWWKGHVLTSTPSGWRQVGTKSGMARTSCK
jgi:hypothetical protein